MDNSEMSRFLRKAGDLHEDLESSLKDLRKHHQDGERKINSDRRFTTMSSRLDHCSGEIESKLKDMKKILEALERENR